jgi:hypothetical protein
MAMEPARPRRIPIVADDADDFEEDRIVLGESGKDMPPDGHLARPVQRGEAFVDQRHGPVLVEVHFVEQPAAAQRNP